ncbi:XRE family transcriptional regulator [Pontibacter diazotrophicus]|uniref:XRE family transcriptional regulator n=1 Tax=Pontibacter diazotrophicus TaxID=1400979 RepID=A0A3D8L3H4_9BACT|nr:helix-turn-helix transcriptional regulator [Pontibacter diazotrophicus]RDV11895.1 XRE family transcriptional regulator [Pontibacter diazotrophicus]
MNITLSDIGGKLNTFRKTLGLSQKEVSVAMGVHQTQISKLEKGEGSSIELLLQILNYYSSNYQVKYILADTFEIVMGAAGESLTSPYNSIAVERLSLLGEEVNAQLVEVKKLLSSSPS